MKIIKQYSDLILYYYERSHDYRGFFQKTFNFEHFKSLDFSLKEQYFSVSKKGVLRGFHFQTPPYECDKIIFCLKGKVLDVVIDLRKKSKTYLKCFSFVLSEKKAEILFIPKGFGHSFLGINNENLLVYNTDKVYSRTHDKGILWNSVNFSWPEKKPKISKRDSSFINLNEFLSPF